MNFDEMVAAMHKEIRNLLSPADQRELIDRLTVLIYSDTEEKNNDLQN